MTDIRFLNVALTYAHDWLNGRLRGDIERAARQALDTPTRINVITGDTHA